MKTESVKSMLPKPMYKVIKSVKRFCESIPFRINSLFFPSKSTLFCPCCGLRFKSFAAQHYQDYTEQLDVKRYEHTRQDVLCPFCRSLPRHRILAMWFERHLDLLRSSSTLYFAPDYCELIWIDRRNVSCTTADLFRKEDLRLDIQDTHLADESYDLIVANHVLEHVDDFRKALKELHRILKWGGSFICSFPMDPKIDLVDEDPSIITPDERIKRFGQYDHKRVFGMNADRLLTESGFKVEIIDGNDYPEEILPIIGPADYDMSILYRCVK